MVTTSDLQSIAGSRSRSTMLAKCADAFNKNAAEFGIVSQTRVAAFLSNISVESGGFRRVSESLNYTNKALISMFGRHRISATDANKYGRIEKGGRVTRSANQKAIANILYGGKWGRDNLGNTKPGDGWLFRGMGWGQMTGRAHAQRIADVLGVPVEDVPRIMRDPVKGMIATMRLWDAWDLNSYADRGDMTGLRRKWNGGTHGLDEFLEALERCKKLDLRLVIKRTEPVTMTTKGPLIEFKPNPSSPILPRNRPKQLAHITRKIIADSPLDTTDSDVVSILFVRGYYADSMGKAGVNDRKMYDDAAFVVTPDGVTPFNANSDPSVHRKRVATLKSPQVIQYKPGKHGLSRPDGGYDAFRQHSDVTVIRDGVGEDRDTPSKRFWCNLHRGGTNGTSSLGCLTIPPNQWDEFRTLVYGSLKKYRQEVVSVWLVEYDGDNPPVDDEVKSSSISDAKVVLIPTVTTAVVATATFWDKIQSFFTNIFN